MESDKLKVLNTKLIPKIVSMNDAELWNFLLENEERVNYLATEPQAYPASGFIYAFRYGIDWFKKHFLEHVENYREGVIFTMVVDFCFRDEKIYLDYWSRCGYFDNADSCVVKTSDDIMPPVEDESEEAFHKEFFHLLEPHHVENIIAAMEKNFDKLEKNGREDIEKIKIMKEVCAENEGWHVVYVYDI